MKLPRTLLPSLASLVLASTSHAGTYAAPKAVEAAVAPAPDATSTVVGAALNTNDHMTEGSAFLLQPLWDNVGQHGTMGGSLFFAEPYFTWGEEGEFSGSLGLGFRHLFSNEPTSGGNRVTGLLAEGLFVGANVFTDYKRTEANADLWQLGIGVEAGVRYLEVRANYYLPLHDGETISRFDATEFTPTSVGGSPAIRATTRTIDIIEEPMEGWDAELALLIPGLDQYFDVRLIGGFYSFETNTSGRAVAYSSDVEGWKAGVEVRPVPAVVLAGMWYEDENLVEDNWMVSVRLEVPLGKPGSESFAPRRRHLQERLLEPVHRQNAAIQTGISFEPSKVKSTTVLTTAQQANRFLQDLKGWGAVYTGGNSATVVGPTSNNGGGSDQFNAGLIKTGTGATLTLNQSGAYIGGVRVGDTRTTTAGNVAVLANNATGQIYFNGQPFTQGGTWGPTGYTNPDGSFIPYPAGFTPPTTTP
ncbi:inverse autotransporter-like protein with beta domain [Roseimicrobium gellanilyticum]|uniref:Inverse autotransporter-like protein with beta domain n=1 Tax=Roseimicrobium gellanilyticum TaxID=748857 RepID=A0A366HBV4_9BACT|nr:inverse autotransporter beta domain-containing protein [Roseimicrobium gellanilyticum]RBP39757.1 inverse autotransporter-like protein with beta domain [Roseimicrobium gellanilyticum]